MASTPTQTEPAPRLDPARLIDALRSHRVAFVAVGDIAAKWYGARRPTKSMDICPAWDPANLDRLALTLRELDARPKTADRHQQQAVPIDGGLLGSVEATSWRTSAGDLEVLLGIPNARGRDLARYEHLEKNALPLRLGEWGVLTASLADLIRSKQGSDRAPDREALPELRALLEDDERAVERLLPVFDDHPLEIDR